MTFGDRLEEFAGRLDRRWALIVLALAAIYVALLAPSVYRHLWFDELHTVYIAQASSMHEMVEDIRALDLNPPLTYLLARVSMRLLGPGELGARLPFIVGFFVGSMGLFFFIARRAGALWAAAGVGLFWYSPFFYYAAEARPYGILLGGMGLMLVSWDALSSAGPTEHAKRRPWALAGIAVGALSMLLSHVYAPLWIMPFWAGELVRSRERRRIDWPLWAALVLPMAACLTYFPLIQNLDQAVFPTLAQGSVKRAGWLYLEILFQAAPALAAGSAAAFAVVIWRRAASAVESSEPSARVSGLKAHELAFLLASLLPPAILNAMAILKHMAFYDRHAILTVMTGNLLVLLFIAFEARTNRLSGMAAAVMILGFALFLPGWRLASLATPAEASEIPTQKNYDWIHPELPMVANSALTYLEMDRYENPVLLARLYYLVDSESAIKYTQSNLTEGLLVMKQHFPIRANVSRFADFTAAHRHFLVWGEIEKQQGWLLTKLKAEDAQITEIGLFESAYKDSHLYEVTLRP